MQPTRMLPRLSRRHRWEIPPLRPCLWQRTLHNLFTRTTTLTPTLPTRMVCPYRPLPLSHLLPIPASRTGSAA